MAEKLTDQTRESSLNDDDLLWLARMSLPAGTRDRAITIADFQAALNLIADQVEGVLKTTDLRAPEGVATLDATGVLASSQWPPALSSLAYQGTWDAAANTPPLASGVGTSGFFYVVSVAGSTTLDGESVWTVGDWVIFDGAAWQRVASASIPTSEKGAPGGVAVLDENGMVNADQLPTNRQVFTSDGTWVKPPTGTIVIVEAWGAGGGGCASGSTSSGGGGGGGAYVQKTIPFSALDATVPVTVGAGGNGPNTPTADGSDGGNSSFGTHVTAEGGKGGTIGAGGDGGSLIPVLGFGSGSGVGSASTWAGPDASSLWGGGGGGEGSSAGGSAAWGGGGGDGAGGARLGGMSAFGGDGGDGSAYSTGKGAAGEVPAGGGGAGMNGGGDGARGEVRITVL